MRAVHCPGDCGEDGGDVFGTTVFTPDSSVCRAAEHAGVIGSEGGYAIVTKGHPQPYYFGSNSGLAGASADKTAAEASYTVSLPVPDVMSRFMKSAEFSDSV